jgi:crotonobetainyl-CoA:carnitine CoA-transferase CaiB-like acyl-CoA transferase
MGLDDGPGRIATVATLERAMVDVLWRALAGESEVSDALAWTGTAWLRSSYPVAELAAASVGVAGLAVAEWAGDGGVIPGVSVDRTAAQRWFTGTLQPSGWELPAPWDPIAGDYQTLDGWIRLHTNAETHRAAALRVLGVPDLPVGTASREQVAVAVAERAGTELETAIVRAGGCAAELRSAQQWQDHPQGRSVAKEPLVDRRFTDPEGASSQARRVSGVRVSGVRVSGERVSGERVSGERPLRGVRVLDLTRVLAGPTATRFLAGFGAEVLRVDPPWYREPALEPEMTLGKNTVRLDLRSERELFIELLSAADVLVHGYRPGALDGLGLGEELRRSVRPGLVEVALDAYGWTGPWRERRGFDSLVQVSSGIAMAAGEAGASSGAGVGSGAGSAPGRLPVQALDYATGYLAAAAAVRGLSDLRRSGLGSISRLSLARTGLFLAHQAEVTGAHAGQEPGGEMDRASWFVGAVQEQTGWGPALRLAGPVSVGSAYLHWDIAAAPIGSGTPRWLS